jgi:hypothetical protein
MSSAAPSPSRWRFVIQPRWLAWHLFAVAAVTGMLWLGDWQLHRALGGNALSWAYTFEWPVFAVFGVVFWAKTILDEARPKAAGADDGADDDEGPGPGESGVLALPAGPRRRPAAPDPADPELDQYNAYLERLNRQAQAGSRRRQQG